MDTMTAPISGFSVGDPVPDDTTVVGRIARAYRKAMAAHAGAGESMWTTFHVHKADVARALADNDVAAAARLLRNPAATMFLFGFDSLYRDHHSQISDSGREYDAGVIRDDMAKLTGAIGNIDRFDFPNPFPREFGIDTPRGIASYRPLQAIYQAHRLHQIGAKSVLEIGGGLGRTAYYARALGITDYSIVDLPITGVAQAYWLGRVLGGHNVHLHGEWSLFNRSRVKLLPPEALPNRRFDVILNVDSLTEMDRQIAERYIDYARHHCRTFVSINHENNPFTVREILASVGITSERTLYPMRDGYFEEVAHF